MVGVWRKGIAAAENKIKPDGYVGLKVAAADGERDLAAAGGDRRDLTVPTEAAAPAKPQGSFKWVEPAASSHCICIEHTDEEA